LLWLGFSFGRSGTGTGFTLFHLHVAVTRTDRQSPGTFKKSSAVLEAREHWTKKYFLLLFKGLYPISNCHLQFYVFLPLSLRTYPVLEFIAFQVICSILLAFTTDFRLLLILSGYY
jgi:hypothetical protein